VCTRFTTLRANAAHIRRTGAAPGIGFSLAQFAQWFSAQERRCAYCHIPEEYIEHLELRTQMGMPLQRLGVDRLEGELGYETENIVLCCFACNKSRSNTFTATEMENIADGISRAWTARLAAKGINWSRSSQTRARLSTKVTKTSATQAKN
jgi:5-methylcytosine-specific restriction endonuclease McrA